MENSNNIEMIEVDFDPFADGAILQTAPATEAQKEIWASVQLGREANCAYNESMSLVVKGKLDPELFKSSLNDLIARHEILRSTFSTDGSILSFLDEVTIDVPVSDFSGLETQEQEKRVNDILIEEAEEPFNLEHGPLIRAKFIKLNEKLYRVILTAHHIICDGWAMAIIFQDLGTIYQARLRGMAADLPEPSPFSEYAFEDQRHFESESGREADEYWLSLYSGEVPVLDFPTTRPRPNNRTFDARRLDYQFPTELVGRLKKIGAKAGCTFITILIAGYKSYLHRITGQEDLVVGTPAAGQSATGRDRLVGHCVNLLPLRSRISGEMPFSDFLKSIRNLMFDAYENQRYTFGRLIPMLDIPREPGRIPLVPIIFNIDQKTNEDGFNVEGLESDIFSNHRRYENFEMFLNVTSSSKGDRVVVECTYNINLFDEEDIILRMQEFETLLSSICDNPDKLVKDLTLLPENERDMVINQWNDTFVAFPRNKCVHDFIEEHARLRPDKTAAVFHDEHMTFGELNEKAVQLAAYLVNQGLGTGHYIGISMERSLTMLVGLVGILKTGAAYVPLDPEYRQDRIEYMVEDAGLTHIVTQSSLNGQLAFGGVSLINMDSGWNDIAAAAPEVLIRQKGRLHPENVAYVIYTSGSTGKPKGVKVPHRALTNFLLSMKEKPGLSDQDALLAVTTLSFDISGLELFLPLVAGGKLVISDRDMAMDGAALIQAIDKNGISVMQATPSTWRIMLDSGWKGNSRLKVLCGGEAFPVDLARTLISSCREVWNMYGPTETTIWSVINRLEHPDQPIRIGQPIRNTRVYILDKNLNPVPIGVPGELLIGGEGVALGYMNNPELTTRQFIKDPFTASSGDALMYRTGDLCLHHRDGKLEYINRIDNQVKLRGYRIELGEIESIINRYESVKQSVVVCKEFSTGDKRLAAFVIPKKGGVLEDDGLRAHLKNNLPGYMIPQHFFEITDVPLTPAGKTDRKKLTENFSIAEGTSREKYEAPVTETEKNLFTIWSDVLKIEKIGVTENFFDLGGHSLLATRVVAMANKSMGCAISLRQFFEQPTIRGLAGLIGETKTDESRPVFTITPKVSQGPVPVSLQQRRLWFLDKLDNESFVYNLPDARRIKGLLNVDILEKCLQLIFNRHGILRSCIKDSDYNPVLEIRGDFEFKFQRVDLSDIPENQRGQAVMDEMIRMIRVPFNLAEVPLFKSVIFILSPEEHIFFLMPHHAVWDGWSFDIFHNEIGISYKALIQGKEPELPELPLQYDAFAQWQNEWVESGDIEKQLEYWGKKLGGKLPTLELNPDFPRPPVISYNHAGTVFFTLDRELTDRLTAFAKEKEATLFMLLLATFKLLLYQYSNGQRDIIVGAPISGRNYVEIENLIGFFVNTLVLRDTLDPTEDFFQFIDRVKQTCLEAFSHQDTPFEKLIERLNPVRDTSRSQLFQALFSYQDVRERETRLSDLTYEQLNIPRQGVQTDLDYWVRLSKFGITGGFDYNKDLFRHETIARMADQYKTILNRLVQRQVKSIPDLIKIGIEEYEKQINTWNDTQEDYPRELCVHQLIRQQASACGSSIAVSFNGHELTYLELDKRSDALAAYLRHAGVQSGRYAGLFMDRSADMVVAMLAVHKAGGAYIPLDPSYPVDRIRYMVETSKADVIVTQSWLDTGFFGKTSHILCIDKWNPEDAAGLDVPAQWKSATPEDSCYVIFTSGSTGLPKGVKVPHRALVNFLNTMTRKPGFGTGDSILAVTTLSFDISGLELFLPLINGGTVYLADKETASDGFKLQEALKQTGATVMQATPSTWRMMLDSGWEGDPGLKVLCGGEAFPKDLALELTRRCKEVWNMYGPTETTIWSVINRISESDGKTLIGRPIGNTKIYLLDDAMHPVPIGVVGELYIGGDGVTNGYINRPDLTEKAFLPDRFTPGDETARIYKTGDLCRYMPDGCLEYIGRIDDQVKLRGFRIELGEIETVLSQRDDILQAVVKVHDVASGDQRLVAYLKTGNGHKIEVSDIRGYLGKRLPDYMVPQHVVMVDDFPLTPAGKVNRKELSFLLDSSVLSGVTYVPPSTETEKLLMNIWTDCLGIDDIGIHDNFFDVGGHSLLAVKMFSKIKQSFNVELPLATLFRTPTVHELARRIDAELYLSKGYDIKPEKHENREAFEF